MPAHALDPAHLSHIVVLGGEYDERDRFMTAGGPVYGDFVHAALIGDGEEMRDWEFLAILMDIPLGAIVGALFASPFERTARWRRHADHRFLEAPSAERLRATAVVAASALGRTLRLIAITALAWVTLRSAAWPMEQRGWANPGAVILAMFIHAYAISTEVHHHEERGVAPPSWERRLALLGLRGICDLAVVYLACSLVSLT